MTASRSPRPPARQTEVARQPLGFLAGMALLGMAGLVLVTITATQLADRRFHWWLRVVIASPGFERALFYIGMVALVAAWLGLGRVAREPVCRARWVSLVAFLWSVPLMIGPPLFSHDVYSYLAQGVIARLGLSPYHSAPVVLGGLGYPHVLAAVDPFWRHATAPYGPLFLGVISLIARLTGSHVFAGVILIRLFDLIGLVLLALFVPRLARRGRGDPTRAVWLAVACPLVLLELVAPGHNDLLMAGLMVAGVALALERRPFLGIVVCTLAATIKVPAIAAALFIGVAWARTQPDWGARMRTVAKSIAAALLTAAAVTLITGFGTGWVSTALFSTPGRVRLAITPATDLSITIAKLLHAVGAGVGFGDVDPVLRAILFAGSVIVALALLAKVHWPTLTAQLGLALAAFVIGGPALWPWYLAWGLVLLAAWTPGQDSRVVIAVVVVASFVVRPDGILLFSRGSSPVFAGLWVLLAAAGWLAWRRRGRTQAVGLAEPVDTPGSAEYSTDGLGGARSALAPR